MSQRSLCMSVVGRLVIAACKCKTTWEISHMNICCFLRPFLTIIQDIWKWGEGPLKPPWFQSWTLLLIDSLVISKAKFTQEVFSGSIKGILFLCFFLEQLSGCEIKNCYSYDKLYYIIYYHAKFHQIRCLILSLL